MKLAPFGCLLGLAMVTVVYGRSLTDYEQIMGRTKRQALDIADCSETDNPNLMCMACYAQEVLSADKQRCLSCPKSCFTCIERTGEITVAGQEETICTQCDESYIEVSELGTCTTCGGNCKSCKNEGANFCDKDQCDIGYLWVNNTKSCTRCSLYCGECTTAGTCSDGKCFDGYYLAADKTCIPCSDADALCTKCQLSGTSVKCEACAMSGLQATKLSADSLTCELCTEFCNSCDTAGVGSCDAGKCFSRYTNADQSCSECANFCSDCKDSGSGKCDTDKCNTGYYLTADAICEECPKNCDSCTWDETVSKAVCDKCGAGKNLKEVVSGESDKSCDFCPEFCTRCEMSTGGIAKCIAGQCLTGYAYNSVNGTCHVCPQNCKACSYSTTDLKTKCTTGQCNALFTVRSSDGQCYKCPDNCLQCTDDGTTTNCIWDQCNATISAYNKLDKQCPKCPDNCKSCFVDNDGTMRCSCCKDKYAVRADRTACDACPSNCMSCENDEGQTKCWNQQCTPGYARTTDGVCESCASSAGCLDCIYNSNGEKECLSCRTGWALSNDPVNQACVQCANCAECAWITDPNNPTDGKAECVVNRCNANYVRDSNGVCKACPTGCTTCFVESDGSTTCNSLSCDASSYVQVATKSCIACPPGAQSCTKSGNSLKVLSLDNCLNGYTKSRSGVCSVCPLNCDICSYNGITAKTTCTNCAGGYALEVSGGVTTGQCKKCPSNCLSCSSAETLVCTTGNCKTGYTSESGVCVACASNCNTCDVANSGNCDNGQCKTGYFLDGTVCKECADRSNCISCSATGQCDTCKYGMTINSVSGPGDQCFICPTGCKYCEWVAGDSQAKCKFGMCKAGYVMAQDRTCKQCPVGCGACELQTDAQGVISTKCKTGYCKQFYIEATDGTCKSCPTNCMTCSIDGSGTTKCDDDGCPAAKAQSQTTGACSNCGNNCKKCSTSGTCDSNQCNNNFYYSSGSCLNCHPQCANGCSVSGQCNSGACMENYGRNSLGACIVCDSQYCNNCDGSPGKCVSTQCTREMWNTAGVWDQGTTDCAACAANCTKCSTPGQCDDGSCYTGYYKNSTDSTCWSAADTCVTGCTDCDGVAGGCATNKCEKSGSLNYMYNATGQTCFPCSANCLECTVEKECTAERCEIGFYYNGTDRLCYQCVDVGHCDTCNSNGHCNSDGCTNGYGYIASQAGSTGECQQCQTECKKCSAQGSCDIDQCNNHYGFDVDETGVAKCKKIDCNVDSKWGLQVDNSGTCGTRPTGCLAAELSSATSTSYSCAEDFCQPGYAYNGGSCTACPNGCNSCYMSGGSAVCLFSGCRYGYARMASGSCKACPTGCDECEESSVADKTVCKSTKCSTGFQEVPANTCITCHDGCTQCSLSTSNVIGCTQCLTTYVSRPDALDECYPCPQYCDACTYPMDISRQSQSYSTCTSGRCADRYAMNTDNGVNTCHSCPSSCDKCTYDTTTSTTKCIVAGCSAGTAQNIGGDLSCHACPSNCDNCVYNASVTDTLTTCLCGGCQSGYEQNTFDFTCSTCLADCSHCKTTVAGNDPECLPMQCENGYQWSRTDSGCKPCGDGCATCTLDSLDQPTCVSCMTSYISNGDGTCSACPSNCQTCSSTTSCSDCKSGYARNGLTSSCEACPSNCNSCHYDVTLVKVACSDAQCTMGYGKTTDGMCDKCANNCNYCEVNGGKKCDTNQCDSGYTLNADKICDKCGTNCGTCAKKGECNSNGCVSGYSYNSGSGKCESCPGLCDTCSYDTTAKKMRCSKCSTGSTAKDSFTCERCEAECQTCDYDDTRPKESMNRCLEGKCNVGFGRYNAGDYQCHICPRECHTCVPSADDGSKLICETCNSGFFLNGEQCGLCPRNCIECDGQLSCKKCEDRFVLYGEFGLCAACPASCHECMYENGVAVCMDGKCAAGFAKTADGKCQSCSTMTFNNCAFCTDITTKATTSECTACQHGYTLKDDQSSCSACNTLSNCDVCEDKTVVCKTGKCTGGTTRSPTGEFCGYQCFECTGSDCPEKVGSGNANVKSVLCPSGQKCWAKHTYSNDGDKKTRGAFVSAERGCENANRTCSDSCKVANGQEECLSCCQTTECNDEVSAAGDVRAHVLTILTMTLLALGVMRS